MPSMKFLEQQLVSVTVDTPQETDCSVSTAVLRGLGLVERAVQARWLAEHRAPKEGKNR